MLSHYTCFYSYVLLINFSLIFRIWFSSNSLSTSLCYLRYTSIVLHFCWRVLPMRSLALSREKGSFLCMIMANDLEWVLLNKRINKSTSRVLGFVILKRTQSWRMNACLQSSCCFRACWCIWSMWLLLWVVVSHCTYRTYLITLCQCSSALRAVILINMS